MTTHALRCIDKAGGIDNFVLKNPDWMIGTSGVALRERITLAMNEANPIAETLSSSSIK